MNMGSRYSLMMRFARVYHDIYRRLCGSHPAPYISHFQWLATYHLHNQFRAAFADVDGSVLDVGCGDKPYRHWFGKVTNYVGLDVYAGPLVDVVVKPTAQWPFPAAGFDFVFSSQVLEHVESLDLTVSEIQRVLKKGGSAILAFPFLFNEHGTPYDYRRLTVNAAQNLFPTFELVKLVKIGGIGSTVAILLLNWMSSFKVLKLLLPIWIFVSFVVNLFGLLLDRLDKTGAFYNNVFLIVKKPH